MSDLPGALGTGPGPLYLDLLEATGFGPDSELSTLAIALLDTDIASTRSDPLRANSDGTPAWSCERWIRLRFTPPGSPPSAVRFWIANYAPNPGWTLRYGTSGTFFKPASTPSDIAITAPPTAGARAELPIHLDHRQAYSDWIVLQALWLGSPAPAFIQDTELELAFNWDEG